MKIYWFKAQAPRRAVALAKHLGVRCEFIEMDMMAGALKAADYAALNPNMKAPTLVDDDRVLWESSAIMIYLCTKQGSDMWPAQNPTEQIEVIRWLSWNDCHWAPAVAPFYFEYIVKGTFNIGPPDLELLKSSVPNFLKYAKVLDGHLSGRRYVACGRLTVADFQLASMAADWRESAMPLQEFPHIVSWLDGLNTLPAWAAPWPKAG